VRALLVIEADLIAANATARRCPRVLDNGNSAWDHAHTAIDLLLHEWRETVTREPEPA
jgi:hypothetical protein